MSRAFPPPQSTSDGMGQHALITEKQLRKEDPPLSTVTVVIRGLPTEGPGKIIATLLAAGGIVFGFVLERRSHRAVTVRTPVHVYWLSSKTSSALVSTAQSDRRPTRRPAESFSTRLRERSRTSPPPTPAGQRATRSRTA